MQPSTSTSPLQAKKATESHFQIQPQQFRGNFPPFLDAGQLTHNHKPIDDLLGYGNLPFAEPRKIHTMVALDVNSGLTHLPPSHQDLTRDSNVTHDVPGPQCQQDVAIPLLPLDASSKSVSQNAISDFSYANSNAANPPKIGTRFSMESSKLLSQWFSNHFNYPYPSKEETKILQQQTGLSKTQIKNWLANARRREKMHHNNRSSRKTTPGIDSDSASIDIPKRPDTPAVQTRRPYRAMSPLERWVDSPPETEPAAVSDIFNAVKVAKPSHTWSLSKSVDDGSGQSYNESSDNSHGTSSGSSFASAYSYGSGDSISKTRPLSWNKSRRRRRVLRSKPRRPLASNVQQPFQCTFCAETFKTKYDWQRHEKTLHIPLERWLCSPDGPRAVNPDTGHDICVFCGESEPTDSHISSHNPDSCQERVFNRKDHLKQHLHLVHKSKLLESNAKGWRSSTPIIRSRCGFCGTTLETWIDRVEHLADHFKMGKTMANWTGDWGFDDAITNTLENAIPPYLLGEELNSPFPFEASDISPESPRTAYELLVVELSCFVEMYQYRTGKIPDSNAMQLEACRIIYASELLSLDTDVAARSSWLRDLVMSNETIATQAQFLPIRTPSEGRLRTLEIRGKRTLFEECPLEAQLHDFVLTEAMANPAALCNATLQLEACKILTQLQQGLKFPWSDRVFTWFMILVQASPTSWLSYFRERAYLPSAQCSHPSTSWASTNHQIQSTTSGTILGHPAMTDEFITTGLPMDEEAVCGTQQNQKSILMKPHLTCREHAPSSPVASLSTLSHLSILPTTSQDEQMCNHRWGELPSLEPNSSQLSRTALSQREEANSQQHADHLQLGSYMLHDPNFYKWLSRELGRWVTSTMSPNNPNCHVPSDEEIQHHARCLLYNDDDPWNQTAADNPEWLERFKASVGIASDHV